MTGHGPTTEELSTLAGRVRFLIRTVYPPGGQPMSPREISEEAGRLGESITADAIYKISTGATKDPKMSTLRALAAVFRLRDPAFFFDPAPKVLADAEVIASAAALRDSGVRGLMFRAVGVSADGLENLRSFADQIRRLEKLPEVQEWPAPSTAQEHEEP
jgi:hypothetical protein